jgi:TRAP-type C4-dicarboxylate transport system permease small subunit
LGRLLETLIGILVAVAVVAVFSQVLFRYLLEIPLHWTEELARYLTVWIVLLGAALGFRSDRHFRFLFLLAWLPTAARRTAERLLEGLSAAFLLVFLVATIPLLPIARDQTAPGLEISLIWLYLALPVGAAFMITFLVIGMATGPHHPLPREVMEHDPTEGLGPE